MKTYARTDTGRQRDHNQDTVLCKEFEQFGCHVLAVADGMGGHQAGGVASRVAKTELEEVVGGALEAGRTDERRILSTVFEEAHDEINALADENPDFQGMGTTLVTAFVADTTGLIGNVGDSRGYLITPDTIDQLTEDHTLVREMVRSGQLSREEAHDHPQRHVLTQALGTDEPVEPDFFDVSLTDEKLLLCSDGLTEEVSDSVIQRIVTDAPRLESAGDQLVDAANGNGGSDNISVVLAARDRT